MNIIDQLDRVVNIPHPPKRIISLCPSITETLFSLGLGEKVVGRTLFCIHPQPAIQQVPHIGGTKNVKLNRLHALKPDLIIAEKEENTPEVVYELEKHYAVYVADVKDLTSAFAMIEGLGELTNESVRGHEMAQAAKKRFAVLPSLQKPLRTVYLIWQSPYMAVGQDTYIQAVLDRCGFDNVCLSLHGRYPELTLDQLKALSPELILLSSEPFPFKNKHLEVLQAEFPAAKVMLVDGEMFSWYGSRMLEAVDYLGGLMGNFE